MPTTDLTFLNSFAGGNKDKIAKYVNLFLQHAPAMVSTIEQHLAGKDYASLKTTAHALKPQITYMGIKSAEELIREIEHNAGENKNLDQLPGQVEKLKAILGDAYPELKKAVES
jgi:HPt (histidine-containing phosphotransfer) domain-containing protein